VDFQQGKILIREGRVLGQTGIPKSAGSLRDIDMLPPVRQALMEQKAISWLLGGFVFLDAKKKPVHQELFRMKVWEPLLRRCATGHPTRCATPLLPWPSQRGEHQLGGPDVGAQEPGGDPGEIQPVCAESD